MNERNLWEDADPLPGGPSAESKQHHHNTRLAQLRLIPPAPHNAPRGTSEKAAALIAHVTHTIRQRIFDFIASRGAAGATDEEGEAALGIKPQTYTPRRGELVALGLVADSGRRRKTASGRPAAVWVTAAHAPKPATIGAGVVL